MKLFRRVKKAVYLIYRRPKGFFDYCLDLFSALVKSKKVLGLPIHVTIEPTNICNIHCPVCPTGAGILRRAKGMMNLQDFRLIINKIYQYTNSILFYYIGEPFLNKEIYEMIDYAKGKGIYITTCTNGEYVEADKIIISGVDEISFQVGGITQNTHEKYRVGGNLDKVLKNIKAVLKARENYKSNIKDGNIKIQHIKPKVIIGFVVMRHNEHEIDDLYKIAKEIGIDEVRVIVPCVSTFEQGKDLLPNDERYWFYDRKAFENGMLMPKYATRNRCNWIYFSTVIMWNGDVVPCCRDMEGEYIMGNILKEDLASIWNGKKYKEFRKAIREKQDKMELCSLCSDFGIPALYQ